MLSAGQRLMTLEVRASNQAAFELYRSCGMRHVGKRKRYYRAPAEDALLLTTCFSCSESADGESPSSDAEGRHLDALVRQSDVAETIQRAAADSAACSRGEAELQDLALLQPRGPGEGPGSFGQLLGFLQV